MATTMNKLARSMIAHPSKIITPKSKAAPAALQRVITRAQSNGGGSSADLPARQEPSRGLSLWDSRSLSNPWAMMRQMEHEMNSMMRGFGLDTLETPMSPRGTLSLAVDVKETDNSYEITADLPGLSKDNINIEVTPDHVLRISGERKHESTQEEEGFVRVERSFGSFQRRFKLPDNVDIEHIKADIQQGVLKIDIPKAEGKEEKKTIKIDIGEQKE